MVRDIENLADTGATTSGTTGFSNLLVKQWLHEINDAAKKKFFFKQACSEYHLPDGTKDLAVPYRSQYLSTMTDTTAEATAVTFTALDNLNAVTFTPTMHAYGVGLSNYSLQTNAVNLIQAAKDELATYWADVTDQAVVTALYGATDATASTRGSQIIYAGDATTTTTLAPGDVLTTDMIAEAKRRLQSTYCHYWSGSSDLVSSAAKPPWFSEPGSPFILFIAPEQEAALMKDSQFINAAEYGSGEVVLNGEIGKYLGIKILTSPNVTAGTTWGGSTYYGHELYMLKANNAVGVAYGAGANPDLKVFDFPSNLEQRLVLYTTFIAHTIHDDAIVKMFVLDD